MKLSFLFFIKYVFSSRSISLIRSVSILCILGFMISLASFIIVISIMSGFGASIEDQLLKNEPHLVISPNRSASLKKQNLIPLVIPKLKEKNLFSEIKNIRYFETQDLIIQSKSGVFSGVMATGYLPKDLKLFVQSLEKDYFSDINLNIHVHTPSQTTPQAIVNKEHHPYIHIGRDLSYQLNLKIGDTAFLIPAEELLLPFTQRTPPVQVKIQSILDSLPKQSLRSIFYESNQIQSLKNTASLSTGVEIFLNHAEKASLYKKHLSSLPIQIESWKDRNSSMFFALKVEKLIMIIFLLLASVISSFSIASMTRLMLAQKKQDIGILMVMGYSIQQIRKLFVRISFMLSLIGAIGGIVLGVAICFLIKYKPIAVLPDIYQIRSLPVELNTNVLFTASVVAIFLAYLTTIIPVYSYTLSSCVELLRKQTQ